MPPELSFRVVAARRLRENWGWSEDNPQLLSSSRGGDIGLAPSIGKAVTWDENEDNGTHEEGMKKTSSLSASLSPGGYGRTWMTDVDQLGKNLSQATSDPLAESPRRGMQQRGSPAASRPCAGCCPT